MYILAVLHADGSYRPFYTAETDNLFASLHTLLSTGMSAKSIPAAVSECLHRSQCYFTYYVITKGVVTEEVEKLLAETVDPVVRLKIFPTN